MMEKNETTFIDVRTPDEFAGGHIDGAINIPLDMLQQNIPAVAAIPGPKVLYCRSGGQEQYGRKPAEAARYSQCGEWWWYRRADAEYRIVCLFCNMGDITNVPLFLRLN